MYSSCRQLRPIKWQHEVAVTWSRSPKSGPHTICTYFLRSHFRVCWCRRVRKRPTRPRWNDGSTNGHHVQSSDLRFSYPISSLICELSSTVPHFARGDRHQLRVSSRRSASCAGCTNLGSCWRTHASSTKCVLQQQEQLGQKVETFKVANCSKTIKLLDVVLNAHAGRGRPSLVLFFSR